MQERVRSTKSVTNHSSFETFERESERDLLQGAALHTEWIPLGGTYRLPVAKKDQKVNIYSINL